MALYLMRNALVLQACIPKPRAHGSNSDWGGRSVSQSKAAIDRTSRMRYASLCADWTHALNQSDRCIPPVPIRMPEDAHTECPETIYSTILQNKMNVLSD